MCIIRLRYALRNQIPFYSRGNKTSGDRKTYLVWSSGSPTTRIVKPPSHIKSQGEISRTSMIIGPRQGGQTKNRNNRPLRGWGGLVGRRVPQQVPNDELRSVFPAGTGRSVKRFQRTGLDQGRPRSGIRGGPKRYAALQREMNTKDALDRSASHALGLVFVNRTGAAIDTRR